MFKKIILISLVIGFLLSFTTPSFADSNIKTGIAQILKQGPAKLLGAEGHGYSAKQIDKILSDFYHSRQLQPLWVNTQGPQERAEILLSFLDASSAEGLKPKDYHLDLMNKFWNSNDSLSLAKLDILLTLELAHYVGDARTGRANPRKLDPKLFAEARKVNINILDLTKNAFAAKDLRVFLKAQPPQHRYYQNLIKVLSEYRIIARKGGWPKIPTGPTLKPGMNDKRIVVIRQRLAVTNDLQGDSSTSSIYDAGLEKAVKHFQERHFLNADGVIGRGTVAAMNISAQQRVRQIVINMERWRWLSREIKGKQIFVNIAGYFLVAAEGEEIQMRMPIIVGKDYHMTPVFSGKIQYAEFNPYWNVPDSITKNEYLPKLQQDQNALVKKNIRIFSGWKEDAPEVAPGSVDWKQVSRAQMGRYRLRQDPGPKNALGTVKFIFPNKHHVYLHDTPNHNLFNKENRTLSHGCIRVSQPHELAAYILGGEASGWDLNRVKAIVESGKRKVVNLKQQMPVHILYRTAMAGDDGIARFGHDVYGRDLLLEKALY